LCPFQESNAALEKSNTPWITLSKEETSSMSIRKTKGNACEKETFGGRCPEATTVLWGEKGEGKGNEISLILPFPSLSLSLLSVMWWDFFRVFIMYIYTSLQHLSPKSNGESYEKKRCIDTSNSLIPTTAGTKPFFLFVF
jgi:hypothetical protein